MVLVAAFLRFWQLDVLPLGFHHDEALDAFSASRILSGEHPVFFTNTNPREPLMIYLQSLGVLLFGATRLGARFMPAVVGTAGVVLCWLLVGQLFGRRVAVLAAGFLAVSFWQLFESRISARAISQPLIETAAFLFLWRALTHRRWPDTVLAGGFLGLSLYTYTAARAVPFFVLLLLLWQVAFSPRFIKTSWLRILVIGAVAVVAFTPLGLYFIAHPDDFWGRSLQVNVVSPQAYSGNERAGGVIESTLNTLGMFSIRGDSAWKYNFSNQPVFDPLVSLLFYAGILLAAAQVVRYLRTNRSERCLVDPYVFVLLWSAVMLLPGFLSSESPHFLRTIGVIPAVFIFPALASDWVIQRWRWAAPAIALFIGAEGAVTYQRYFIQWAHNTDAYYAQHGDVADAALYLASNPPAGPLLFSTEYPGHPTMLYLAPNVFGQIRWFNGQESLVFPPTGQRGLVLFPAQYKPGFAPLSQFFSPDQLVHQGQDPSGAPSYQLYRLAQPGQQSFPRSVSATIGNLIQLDGAAFPDSVRGGQAVTVLEHWKALNTGPQGLRAFVHLVDARGHLWAQSDRLGFYSEDWRPGDVAITSHVLDVPAGTPPVPMKVLFGLYQPKDGTQLPIVDANGKELGTQVQLGTLTVAPPTNAQTAAVPHPLDVAVAPNLKLAGFQIGQPTVEAGATLPVSLYWRVAGPVGSVPALQIQGVVGQDAGLAQDLAPGQWPSGLLEDRHDLTFPPTMRAGTATLSVAGQTIGTVAVTEPRRDFTVPPVAHPLNLPVRDFGTLVGYEVGTPMAGQSLPVTLIWQDKASVPVSYKTFVHVLDGSNKVVAQRDALPQGGAMPTTYWLPGQVVVDRYDIPLPAALPSGLKLEIGLYEEASGKRVPIGKDDQVTLPLG